jgi:hypothetical protein
MGRLVIESKNGTAKTPRAPRLKRDERRQMSSIQDMD